MNKLIARCSIVSVLLCAGAVIGCGLNSEAPKIDKSHIYNVPDENTVMLCTDGIDNDNDTVADCDDPGCRCENSADSNSCPSNHPGATVCPGAIDPDTNAWAPAENTVFACSDGKDNDGNGYADCKDNNCKKTAACCIKTADKESDDLCNDGVDNDCNGYTDCGDNSCKKSPLCCTPTGAENTDAACTDGIDNDCNGYADCNDNNCKKTAACCIKTGEENDLASCMDGLDNDCNGYVDCRDNNCSRSSDPMVKLYCCTPSGSENTLSACSDGVDNDCDGYTDCRDASCYTMLNAEDLDKFKGDCEGQGITLDHTLVDELETIEYITELKQNIPVKVIEYNEETCSDQKDNDLNGLIDCADSGCKDTEYCQTAVPEPGPRPAGFESLPEDQRKAIYALEMQLCTDKDSDGNPIDNDKNGKANCDDYECRVLSVRSQSAKDPAIESFRFTCQTTSQPDSETPDQGENE